MEKKIPKPIPKGWYDKKELDEKIERLDYEFDGEIHQVEFLVRAQSKNEMRVLESDFQVIDATTGDIDFDTEGRNYARILECVFDVDESGKLKPLSRQKLDAIKRNKASGIYDRLNMAVAKINQEIMPERIAQQKNSESPVPSETSS